MVKYLLWSDFKIAVDFNPCLWKFDYYTSDLPKKNYPNMRYWFLRILFLSFFLIIDDGTVVFSVEELDEAVVGDPYDE